jgi:hypothetical protein
MPRGVATRRSWAPALAAVVVLVVLLPGGSGAGGPSAEAGAVTASTPPGLYYHANLYATTAPPNGTTPVGELIGAEYALDAPTLPASSGAATVQVPAAVVTLPASSGPIHVTFGPVNVSLAGPATATASAGASTRFGAPLVFNASPAASYSTQGLAVMASWPAGAYPVEFRWHWLLDAPDGRITGGPWSNTTSVVPAQTADVSIPTSRTWVTGTSPSVCVAGPVAGRTFSVHLSITTPSSAFVTSTVTVPAAQSGPYCWPNPLPAGTASQSAFLHVWEIGNQTFLLDVLAVRLLNAPAANGPQSLSSGPHGPPPWLLPGLVLTGIVALVVLGWLSPGTVRRLLPNWGRRPKGEVRPPAGAEVESGPTETPSGPTPLPPPPPPPS